MAKLKIGCQQIDTIKFKDVNLILTNEELTNLTKWVILKLSQDSSLLQKVIEKVYWNLKKIKKEEIITNWREDMQQITRDELRVQLPFELRRMKSAKHKKELRK